MTAWNPPGDWLRITTIDAHTAGEPLRIVTSGLPGIPGKTMLGKRRYVREHLDHLRTALMWEPRGHADMYGCILTEPETEDGDLGVLFLHNEGYSTMCGHGIIGVVKVGLECGFLRPGSEGSPVRIDTPAGRVEARARWEGERVKEVRFRNVPSFLLEPNLEVVLSGIGKVLVDIAFGGAFYAYVEAAPLGLELRPEEVPRLVEVGMAIKRAASSSYRIRHPAGEPDLDYLYGTIFVGPSAEGHHSRNICVFAEGEVDRSPTGTGVSGRAAILHARGQIAVGERISIESIVGTRFEVKVVEETTVGSLPAVVPEVSGEAHITGRHEFLIDPADPLGYGFLLR